MKNVNDALTGVSRLGFDTAPIIYFIEANPVYDTLVNDIFQRIASKHIYGITSVITLIEVLVHPLLKNDRHLQQEYRDVLLRSPHFETMPIDRHSAEEAAHLRARYSLRTPDALQIAVAIRAGCDAFVTNDTGLRRVTEIRIVVLDDLVTV